MGKYQEVEVKYPLFNMETVIDEINKLNMKHIRIDEKQIDTYYNPIHRDFLANDIVSEWLRIRVTDKKCTFNFKQWLPIGAKIQNQCNEYETEVQDAYALKKVLELLDFKEIIVVNKTRNSWLFENVEISIDVVEELGSFIELEAINVVEECEIKNMQIHFNCILNLIRADIGERNHRGYPYMLLEKVRRISNAF